MIGLETLNMHFVTALMPLISMAAGWQGLIPGQIRPALFGQGSRAGREAINFLDSPDAPGRDCDTISP